MDKFISIFNFHKLILSGLKLSIELSVLDILLSTVVGIIGALVITSKSKNAIIKSLQAFFKVYIEVFRGSPLLLQIFFIYYGMGYLGIDGRRGRECS